MFYVLQCFVLLSDPSGSPACVVGGCGGAFLFSFASPNKAKLSLEGMQANAGMINTAVGCGGYTRHRTDRVWGRLERNRGS